MYQTFCKILQGDVENVETNFITRLYNVSPAAKLMLYFILYHSEYTVCRIPRRLSVIWTVNDDLNPSYVNQV